ncbi:hypothetical protein KPL71_001659 [Citrus sinensis]|uniref:Uncharacterized protein n=1 Tax=Citrus sinensis TaxID=2711 RepID=A0ACB8NYD5_CITSI|nr:hypothetical protein KPL71_001659 [Citrus sinensis]
MYFRFRSSVVSYCFSCLNPLLLPTITSSHSLSDGRTLVSKDRSFELGFFSPGSSKNRYVGIWYKNMPVKTVVWVANRINPINDSSGLLVVNETGNLVLTSQNKSVVWSANLSKEVRTPVIFQLLDSGNLVLRGERDGGSETYLWQSFDYPSDTLLPGMKLGWDLKTGLERRITSWKSSDDPSRSATTTHVRSRSVTTTLVRSRTVTNDLPGYDSGSICT